MIAASPTPIREAQKAQSRGRMSLAQTSSPTNILPVEMVVLAKAKNPSFYRPELDCLRFFAFLAVFVHHTIPKTADFYLAHHLPTMLANVAYAGAFGVDLFFCLSAYLITELLLREKDQVGHLNVKAFYIRRMLRIWPLYFTFVLFAFGLSFIDRTQHFSATQLTMFLMLAGNWPAATTSLQSVVVPLWSVSIEEQFYLLWPLAVRRATRKQILTICILMVSLAFAWRFVIQTRMHSPHDMIWNSTFSHLDSIAYGILLSLVPFQKRTPPWMRLAFLLGGLSAWLFAASVHDQGDVMMAFVALGSVTILRAAVGAKLNHPVLVRLGVVSYGLYVYHELFMHVLNWIMPPHHVLGFVLWWVSSLFCTMIAAFASYRWLESPFLRLKHRFAIVKSRPV
jgi:peptidoglycan/LPS O-acetylase OafA/YrhL